MLSYVCSLIDHRKRVVRTSVTHSPYGSFTCFFFVSPHFDVICDLLLKRRTATWNLFVKKTRYSAYTRDTSEGVW